MAWYCIIWDWRWPRGEAVRVRWRGRHGPQHVYVVCTTFACDTAVGVHVQGRRYMADGQIRRRGGARDFMHYPCLVAAEALAGGLREA